MRGRRIIATARLPILMRLDPVFLVAPEPEPPRPRFSRRQLFAAAAGAFGVGWAFGLGLRHALDASATAPADIPPEDAPWIAWAEELQVGPSTELLRNRSQFLVVFTLGRHAAERLAPGVQLLASSLLQGSALSEPERHSAARDLLQALSMSGVPGEYLTPELLTAVRELAR